MKRKYTSCKSQDKPLSKTQQKKQWKEMMGKIKLSEKDGVIPHYTCHVCCQNLIGSNSLLQHLTKHPFTEWDWSRDYRSISNGVETTTSLYSRGSIQCVQLSGVIVATNDIVSS